MTTAPASELDWSGTRQWIGRNLLLKPREGADAVERSSIRRELEVLEFGCPLHYDDAVAKRYGYQGIFAPAHMVQVYQVSSIWEPGTPSVWTSDDPHFNVQGTGRAGESARVPTPGTAGFVTDLEVEFYQSLYVGDKVIQTENKLLEVNPRRTRVGDGAFLTYESTYVNQRGAKVARQVMVTYSYVPSPQPAAGSGRPAEAQTRPAEAPALQPTPPADWSKQRYWEDVKEGDEIPEVHYPLTVQRMVMSAGANRDFNSIHHNSVVAQRGGAPDMYAMNFFHHGMWERAVREFIGLGGTIRKVGPFRMRVFSPVGDTVIVKGKVARKFQEGKDNLVELEIQSVLAKGGAVSVGPGPVLATLPSRTAAR